MTEPNSAAMRRCSPEETGPVTMTLVFGIRAGKDQDFERALRALQASLRGARGYLGTEVVHDGARHEYTSILRFSSLDCMNAWEASGQREAWQRELSEILTGDAQVRYAHGIEFWFETPERPVRAPSPHKMALVFFTLVALISFPLSLFLSAYLPDLPRIGRILFSAAVQVTLLTYVIMPRVTRLLAFWLYAEPAPRKAKSSVPA